MTRRVIAYCVAALLSGVGAGLYSACDDSVKADDCKVRCANTKNTCVEKCSDDNCKTVCTTDLNNCTASCESITVAQPDGG